MHVHLPKPLHGWREFMGEVGVIVLGVLIAIALGQIADPMRWQVEVRDARAALTEDMGQSNRVFAYRVAAHDCIARRLNTLNDIIERAAKHEPVPKVGEVIPNIGNGLFKNAWETSRAAQTRIRPVRPSSLVVKKGSNARAITSGGIPVPVSLTASIT